MRAVRIFLIGLGGLCLAVLLRLWLKWAVLSAATLPLLLILVRQFYLSNSKRSVQLWMNPDLLEFTDELSLRLSGREVSLGFFKRWYEFEIEVCDHWLLSLVALASLGATAVVWITDDLPMPNTFWGWGVPAWFLVCYLAWRWMWERRAMSKSGFALGTFRIGEKDGPLLTRITYQFIDGQGEYYGGSFRTLFCDTRDDLSVVFHDEARPEISLPASAMMFHRLKWVDSSEGRAEGPPSC